MLTEQPIHSAVLVLREAAHNTLVLTKRNPSLRHHPGEICFPGGRWEPQDTDYLATACRELEEELGIQQSRLYAIQSLKVEQTLQGTIIHPWLATIDSLQPLAINHEEVAEVITLPWAAVLKKDNYQSITFQKNGQSFVTQHFTASAYYIWGATARIMQQLGTLNLFE